MVKKNHAVCSEMSKEDSAYDADGNSLSANNQDQQLIHVAFDLGKGETNIYKAGSVRRSNRSRQEPKWLKDFEHKARS